MTTDAEAGPTSRPGRVDARRVAGALAAVIALALLGGALFPLVGGFLPRAPLFGAFGRLLLDGLPLIAAMVVGGLALAALAVAALGARAGAGRLLARLSIGLAIVELVALTVVVGALGASAASHGATWSVARQLQDPPPGGPTDHVTYATVDGVDLDMEIWAPPNSGPGATPPSRETVVLFLHGGGFYGGGLGQRPALFQALAQAGYPVYDAEYRLTPPERWDQAPADAFCALGWITSDGGRNRAATLGAGIDPQRVIVVGESAGATLALQAAYATGNEPWSPQCRESAHAAAVIAISPIVDFRGIWQDGTIGFRGERFPESYIGGAPDDDPGRYDLASPLALVHPGVPPTLVVLAANDSLVHLERSTPIVDALRSVGATVEVATVPFADHGFDGSPNGYGEQLEETLFLDFITRHAG